MKLSQEQISDLLRALPEWTLQDKAIVREFVFPSFPDAIGFVTRLAFDAEAADHHPDLRISYKRVHVTWTTHSEHGLTEKDGAGARRADALARAFGVDAPG
jgi:4a-hydroxytetrahydrobiopterin dehydratase